MGLLPPLRPQGPGARGTHSGKLGGGCPRGQGRLCVAVDKEHTESSAAKAPMLGPQHSCTGPQELQDHPCWGGPTGDAGKSHRASWQDPHPAEHPGGILVPQSIPTGSSSCSAQVSLVTSWQGTGMWHLSGHAGGHQEKPPQSRSTSFCSPHLPGTGAHPSTQGAFCMEGKLLQHKQGLRAPQPGFGRPWMIGNRSLVKFPSWSGRRQDQTRCRNELL